MNFHLCVLLYHPDSKISFSGPPFNHNKMLSSLPLLHYYLILFSSVKTTEHLWAGKFCLQLQWCSCPSSTLGDLPVDTTSSREWTPCLSCGPQTVAHHPHRQGNDWERPWTEAWMITKKKSIIYARGWTSLPVLATSRHSAIISFSSWITPVWWTPVYQS